MLDKILNEKEQKVLALLFGLTNGQSKTIDEISKILGISTTRVHQIKSNAISKIRKNESAMNALRDFFS